MMENTGNTRVYGGGMFGHPVILENGKNVPVTGILEAVADLASRFFSWVGELLSSCWTSSTAEERAPFAQSASRAHVVEQKANETPVTDAFIKGVTSRQEFSFKVGTEEEIQRYDEKPHLGSLIERNQGKLHPVDGTSIQVMREVDGYMNSGLGTASLDVIGPDGQAFVANSPEDNLRLIANAAGMSVENAFDGLDPENPVSIFQAQLHEHFNPMTAKEDAQMLPMYDESKVMFTPIQGEKSTLSMLPSQKDGAIRYRIDTPHQLGTITGEVKKKFIISQEVTIHRGGQVDIIRTGQETAL